MIPSRAGLRIAAILLSLLVTREICTAETLKWKSEGPGPSTDGQVENIDEWPVVGAIHCLALHPTDDNVLYVGAVNGGIWKTDNSKAKSPNWTFLSGGVGSSSIGALAFDPIDGSHRTLVAGTGRFSSYYKDGGGLVGIIRTTDAGASWNVIGGGVLAGLNVTGVAPRGNTLVVSTLEDGVYRSIDGGNNWALVSGKSGSGLPAGRSYDLASDPADPTLLYTSAGSDGLYKSTDSGKTWTKISSAVVDAEMDATTNNVKFAIGGSGTVYVGIVRAGELQALFRSADHGASWTSLDLPRTTEGGRIRIGLHPGRQGSTHFSIGADPSNSSIVFVGGDSQPRFSSQRSWPNSIGAKDYSGRIFRIDSSKPPGAQATHVTHSNTASNSAPHADSRDIVVTSTGELIEADDGGVYRRTKAGSNTGDWFSVNGNIQTTEFHSVAWDSVTHSAIGGAQDTGVPEQKAPSDSKWRSVSTADGAVVAVDDQSTSNLSVRYSSWQRLGGFIRRTVDSNGVVQKETTIALTNVGGSAKLKPQFYTPVVLNLVSPTRMIIAGENSVYESYDQGDTIREIGPSIQANWSGPIAYGANGNPDILYLGSGTRIYVRQNAQPAPLKPAPSYPGSKEIMGIAVSREDPTLVAVVDETNVYLSKDAANTWTTITGDLYSLKPETIRTVACVPTNSGVRILVGTNTGVMQATEVRPTEWERLGEGLPESPILKLDYDFVDNLVLAATLGRGAWSLRLSGNP